MTEFEEQVIALLTRIAVAVEPKKAKPKQADLLDDRAIRGRKPETPMPEGFHLNGVLREFAGKHGFSKCDFMFSQFQAHHRAKGNKFVDWEAAWRTWVLNQVKYNGGAPQPRPVIETDGRI